MSSPTPREVRRLASDHDFIYQASPRPKQLGWWVFLAANLSIPAAMCIGTIFSIVAIVYTNSTSKQVLDCPAWATSCPRADDWTIDHLGTVQGIITLLFLIGLVALAYAALAVCEAAVWPLLSRQVFTISELEAYLSTTRGSILSAPRALMATKTVATGLVLACAVVVTLLPLAAAPLVGYAFTPTLVPVQLEGNYSTWSAGITQLYAQTDPPTSVMVDVMAEYNSWATDPSSEPLPEYRNWYINRETLAQRGSFSGTAIKLQTSVTCQPHPVKQRKREGLLWNAFETNMTRTRESLSGKNEPAKAESSDVWVRSLPQLTVWVDSFAFVSDHRTTATLVFAAFNGTIQGGEWTPVVLGSTTGSSSIACKVDIEAQDDILTVTEPDIFIPANTQPGAILSSINNTLKPSSSRGAINELLLWFTVAPLLVGSSVDGTQPMFFNSTQTNTAVAYTSSTPAATERNTWTMSGIESMIRLSIGALAQATSTNSPSSSQTETQTTLKSTIKSLKMDPARSLLLIIPPLMILAAGIAISVWNTWVHRREGIPVMRMAGLGEMLKSAQTRYLGELCATDAAKTYLPSETGRVEVKYGVDKDGVVGLARSVRGLDGTRRVDFQNQGAGAAA
ncbi:hypothetical protein V8F06_011338 [Rhypophila decipiens]